MRIRGKFKPAYLIATLLLLCFTLGLYYSNLLEPLDRLAYDLQIRTAEREPLEDIVIVAIDKYSLDEIGRWPWPRDVHAKFLEKITQVQPKSVVMDIVFSEPSDVFQNDYVLASAITNSTKVVLPVAPEAGMSGGRLAENLPIKMILEGAAGIGHVDRELDFDAVSRRSYLYAGLSDSIKWPSIALQAIYVAGTDLGFEVPDSFYQKESSPPQLTRWSRSGEFLLPFAGKPGTFNRVSYAEVLSDDFDLNSLNNKYILVGATAFGMGDVISTPVSGESSPMPGIEVIANEIDALRNGLMISQLSFYPSMILTCVVVLLSFFLWGFLAPRYSLFLAAGLIGLIFLIDAWVLHHLRIWFAPANLLAGVALGYLGWIWGRLVETVKYLNSELNRLGNISMPVIDVSHKDANKAFEYLMNVKGFHGGTITDAQDKILFEWETDLPEPGAEESKPSLFNINADVPRNEGHWNLSLRIDEKQIHRSDAQKIAQQLTTFYQAESQNRTITPVEFINSRIELVKQAHTKLHVLNNFVSEILDQLHNSVIVTDSFGNIVMANRVSDQLLHIDRSKTQEVNVMDILQQFKFQQSPDWSEVFSNVMFKGEQFIVEAKSKNDKNLLVEVTRYTVDENSSFGMVLNFIDVTKLKESEQSRRELLAFLSHDLRSPLASLIATSDLAKIRPEYRESENFVKSIKDNAKRALQLADDFLALIRAESINTESFEPVDFIQVIVKSVSAIEGSASAKQIKMKTDFDDSEKIYVNGDHSILERVVINLITNAIKYSPREKTVEVGLSYTDQELHFWVKDNGFGIRQQDQQKIFQRFETISHAQSSEDAGTGLGLTFVKSSVERHNGLISLESSVGKGSCFNIFLPVIDEAGEVKKSVSQLSSPQH